MKITVSSRWLFSIGLVLIVVTNIVALSGVAANRAGAPEALITLTERELPIKWRHEENSALALQLDWRALSKNYDDLGYYDWRSPGWFTAEKLQELEFKIDNDPTRDITKEVFIVLEFNGEPYREAVKRAEMTLEKEKGLFELNSDDQRLRDNFEYAEKRLQRERLAESRLFAIDAGLDPVQLRGEYADRKRFIITKGLVTPRHYYREDKEEIGGFIRKLSVENIHVPRKVGQDLDAILLGKKWTGKVRPPRYQVQLAYGNRLEPWIVSITQLDDK